MILAKITTPIYYVTPNDQEHLPAADQVICWQDAEYPNEWTLGKVCYENSIAGRIEISFLNDRSKKGWDSEPSRYAWFPLPQMEIMLSVKPEAQ